MKIYIILSQTNTNFGRIIRFLTHYPYNHVSISTDKTKGPLYSFARYHYNAPFVGGFVEESFLRYLFYGQDVKMRIYSIDVSETQFKKFESIIKHYSQKNSNYIYNTFDALGIHIVPSEHKQTCISFIFSILKDLQILSNNKASKTIKAISEQLEQYPYIDTTLSPLDHNAYTWGNDNYCKKVPFKVVIKDTIKHFQRLLS